MSINNESKPSPHPLPHTMLLLAGTFRSTLNGGGGGLKFYTNNRFARSSPVFTNFLSTFVPDCCYSVSVYSNILKLAVSYQWFICDLSCIGITCIVLIISHLFILKWPNYCVQCSVLCFSWHAGGIKATREESNQLSCKWVPAADWLQTSFSYFLRWKCWSGKKYWEWGGNNIDIGGGGRGNSFSGIATMGYTAWHLVQNINMFCSQPTNAQQLAD